MTAIPTNSTGAVTAVKGEQPGSRLAPIGAGVGAGLGGGVGVGKATDLLGRVSDPTNLVMIGALTGAIGWLFWQWFYRQHKFSWGSEDWGHAYFVPLVAGYLVYLRRRALARAQAELFWPGLAPMLLGIASYVFFLVGSPTHLGQGLGLLLTVFGVVLLMLGPAVTRLVLMPLGFLVFAITLPEMVMIKVTFVLQQWAAAGAYAMLNATGVKTDLRGNVLEILTNSGQVIPLGVAEACSGMRTLIAFVALAGAVALVATGQWWKRAMLMALSVPVALGLNVVRVYVLGVLSLVDPALASGDSHMFIGTLLLVPGFLLFLGVVWALHKASPESGATQSAGASSGAVKAGAA